MDLIHAPTPCRVIDCRVIGRPGSLSHRELRFDQHRTEEEIFVPIEFSVVDCRAEEPSEADRVILALGF
jgi:hypothetical protein